MAMPPKFIAIAIAAVLGILHAPATLAAKPAGTLRCYEADDPVQCFIGIARKKLEQVGDPRDRAKAISELLYGLAATHTEDAALADEARTRVDNRSLPPSRQMDLVYGIDLLESVLAPPADDTYAAALSRFAALERELRGDALVQLYVDACAIVTWDDPFRERWFEFAQSVCTVERLKAANATSIASQALVLTMIPVAMTLADDREGFTASANVALSWLQNAEKLAAKSKDGGDKDFVAILGVLMHAMNAACLDAFDESDAADGEVERALQTMRRMEARRGVSGKTTVLHRQVIESLFNTGREIEAGKLLRRVLRHVDADVGGKKIPLTEQIAILMLAARIAHYELAEFQQPEVPAGQIRM